MRVNSYKLYFLSPHFFLINQRSFPPLYFSILPTKHTRPRGKTKISSIPPLFHPLLIFYPLLLLHPLNQKFKHKT